MLHFKASKVAVLAATVWAARPQTMRSAFLTAAVATAMLASPATARTKEYIFTYSGLDLNIGDTCDTCRITATITLAGPLSQYLDTSYDKLVPNGIVVDLSSPGLLSFVITDNGGGHTITDGDAADFDFLAVLNSHKTKIDFSKGWLFDTSNTLMLQQGTEQLWSSYDNKSWNENYDGAEWVLMEQPWFAYEEELNYESPGSWTELVVTVGTPEPSTWAMMLLGSRASASRDIAGPERATPRPPRSSECARAHARSANFP